MIQILLMDGIESTYQLKFSFCKNVGRELIEIEFREFAGEGNEISAVDFAKIILRYSFLNKEDQLLYIERVRKRSKNDEKVSVFDT